MAVAQASVHLPPTQSPLWQSPFRAHAPHRPARAPDELLAPVEPELAVPELAAVVEAAGVPELDAATLPELAAVVAPLLAPEAPLLAPEPPLLLDAVPDEPE